MDKESLTFLLRGGHYNMEQRRERGIWPHAPLRFDDLVRHLAELLRQERWFPFEREPHSEGDPVDERIFVERQAESRYVCHGRRHHPIDVKLLAEESHKEFDNAEDAARFYLHWNLGLPGDLDSWKVI